MEHSFIVNYHCNRTGRFQTGHVLVSAADYFARWEWKTPDVLYVRRSAAADGDWLELKIGGCCEFTRGDHTPVPATYRADFESDPSYRGSSDWDRTLTFHADSRAGGTYEYRLRFEERRIRLSLSYSFSGTLALAHAWYGTLDGKTGSRVFADCIFNPAPQSHALFRHRLDVPQITGSTGENWFSPGPFCFPVKTGDSVWNSFSVFPGADQLRFTSFETRPMPDGSLCFGLDCSSRPPFSARYDAPELCVQFGACGNSSFGCVIVPDVKVSRIKTLACGAGSSGSVISSSTGVLFDGVSPVPPPSTRSVPSGTEI